MKTPKYYVVPYSSCMATYRYRIQLVFVSDVMVNTIPFKPIGHPHLNVFWVHCVNMDVVFFDCVIQFPFVRINWNETSSLHTQVILANSQLQHIYLH